MIKAIIFDFDGVIGDTHDINFSISKEFDPNITEQDFIDHHLGNVFDEPKIKFKPEDVPIFFEKQKKLFTRNHLFPLETVIEKLYGQFQLFVISSTQDENIVHYLSLGNLSHYFKEVLGSTTHKSKVEKFKMIFKEYNISPLECIFITDTVGDIIEAKKVGVSTIGVTWGYHDEKLLLSHNPSAIVNTPTELLATIEKLSN